MKIKIGFTTVLTLLTLIVTHPLDFPAAVLAATLHELGHMGMAHALKIRFQELSLDPFGATLIPKGSMGPYRNELMIVLAGPSLNLLSTCALLPLCHRADGFLFFFCLSSLFLGLFNLMPIRGFDGGRILLCTLSRMGKPLLGERILSLTSFLFLFLLWCFSVYLLLRVGASLSLFVFSCSLFLKLFVDCSSS